MEPRMYYYLSLNFVMLELAKSGPLFIEFYEIPDSGYAENWIFNVGVRYWGDIWVLEGDRVNQG